MHTSNTMGPQTLNSAHLTSSDHNRFHIQQPLSFFGPPAVILFNGGGGGPKNGFPTATCPPLVISNPPPKCHKYLSLPFERCFLHPVVSHIPANVYLPRPYSTATPLLPCVPSSCHFLPIAPHLCPPILGYQVNDHYANFVATPSRFILLVS